MKNKPLIGEADGKKQQVEAMFDAIAPRYDLLNRVLSFGIDQTWRTKAIRWLAQDSPQRILDVATGTADLAIAAAQRMQPKEVVGVDIAEEMLAVGRTKVAKEGLGEIVRLERGDAENLPYEDDRFDGALVAFGVRNFEDLDAGLADIRRVLRPGGALVVLEFSQPTMPVVKQGYGFYSKHILPRIGQTLSKDSGAYEYLPESIKQFPSGPAFLRRMAGVGFTGLDARPLTFGVASLYKGYA